MCVGRVKLFSLLIYKSSLSSLTREKEIRNDSVGEMERLRHDQGRKYEQLVCKQSNSQKKDKLFSS